MKSFAHIGIFISMSAVKHEEPMCIVWKMRRHPVQYHTDAFLVKRINQPHQALRISKP